MGFRRMKSDSEEQHLFTFPPSNKLTVLKLGDVEGRAIANSARGFSRFTVVINRALKDEFSKGQLCLIYTGSGQQLTTGYLGVVSSKQPIATTSYRIGIQFGHGLRHVLPGKLAKGIRGELLKARFLNIFESDLVASRLSDKLGAYVLDAIEANNADAVREIQDKRSGYRTRESGWRLQASVVADAVSMFGITRNHSPEIVVTKHEHGTSLEALEAEHYLMEDQVLAHDARQMPGWELVNSSMTGFATFTNGNTELQVFTANRTPVEKAVGVDLIYINQRLNNAVMIQYKMLEEEKDKDKRHWIYRPDKQFDKEMERMKKFELTQPRGLDYRLSYNPFFLKFVRRVANDMSNAGVTLTIEHFVLLCADERSLGKKGGRRIDFELLCGRYLRKDQLVGLVESGYVGTAANDTERVKALIELSLSASRRSSVVAYERIVRPSTVASDDEGIVS